MKKVMRTYKTKRRKKSITNKYIPQKMLKQVNIFTLIYL